VIHKILLLGNTGQLGWELNRTLITLGDLIALDYPQIDMSSEDNIISIVREIKPNLIVNATAYTNVDKAESQPELAMAINGTGPGVLAEEAKQLGAALIHYSTDYVFSGTKGTPYIEKDEPDPISVYGETKLAGEKAVQKVGGTYWIFRTSWVYSLRRPCFVTKVLQWAQEYDLLRIVDDQVSSPTWARTLAEVTSQIIAQNNKDLISSILEKKGLYNLTDSGFCSRYEWAKAILELALPEDDKFNKEIKPAKSSDFATKAKRPLKSFLSCGKFEETFGLLLPPWGTSLELAMK